MAEKEGFACPLRTNDERAALEIRTYSRMGNVRLSQLFAGKGFTVR